MALREWKQVQVMNIDNEDFFYKLILIKYIL